MLKFQITTKEDLKEAAALQRKKQYEEERKARIFNPRERLFGKDHETLEKQIAEKKKRRQEEEEFEQKFIEEESRRKAILDKKEKELEEERRRINTDINFYRTHFQRKQDTREFDLNDPEFHRKSKPARSYERDPNLGISAAQVFIGEDYANPDRKKKQIEQQRAWLEQQIKERQQAEEDRKKADLLLQKSLVAREQQTLQLAAIEECNRVRMKEAVANYNKNLALEQEAKRKLQKLHKEEDDLAEIYNMMTSDMLTENPDVANSSVNMNKKVGYLFKGMTKEERMAYRKAQEDQRKENKKKKDEEAISEAQWLQQSASINRNVMLKQREIDRRIRQQREEIKKTNTELAMEQKCRKEYYDKVLYSNVPTPEFFNQFNKDSR